METIARGAERKKHTRREGGGSGAKISPTRSSEEKKRKGKERRNKLRVREKEKRMEYEENEKMAFPPVGDREVLEASAMVQNRRKKMKVSQCKSVATESSWVHMNGERNFQQEERKTEARCGKNRKW